MKTLAITMLALSVAAGWAAAADFWILRQGTWVCSSSEAYAEAIELQAALRGGDFEVLKKDLLVRKLCIYIDAGDIEDMMAPFVQIHSEQGGQVKVSFTIEFHKRIEFLHRRMTRVTFGGWTAMNQLHRIHLE